MTTLLRSQLNVSPYIESDLCYLHDKIIITHVLLIKWSTTDFQFLFYIARKSFHYFYQFLVLCLFRRSKLRYLTINIQCLGLKVPG